MRKLMAAMALLLVAGLTTFAAATEPIRVIMFGAHPDDCDLNAGGTAALFAEMGHKVKFVSLTNGDKGHHEMKPEALAARRKKEMQEAGKSLGITYDNLDNHDGELMATLENRKAVIHLICDWEADIVITHRPNDYHPDHRYASIIVQDAAYMISVPGMMSGGKPLLKAPVFLYMEDRFQKPNPFTPDILIDVTPVIEKKIDAIRAHESQIFEWLPWNGGYTVNIPTDAAGKRKFVADNFLRRGMSDKYTAPALKWYSPDRVGKIQYVETFEICEYGTRPDAQMIKALFPMLPRSN